MDVGSEDIDRQLDKLKIFPGMHNLRKHPFSMDCYHLFQSTDKQMIYGRIYRFFPSVLDDHERVTLHEELRRYDVWEPPAHIEAAFEQDNDSGIMISIRISADQYWQKVSHVKTGDLEFWQSSLQLCCAFHMAMPILNKYFLSSRPHFGANGRLNIEWYSDCWFQCERGMIFVHSYQTNATESEASKTGWI